MQKLISFFMIFSILNIIYSCESHRNDDVQEEQERMDKQNSPTRGTKQRAPTEGNPREIK